MKDKKVIQLEQKVLELEQEIIELKTMRQNDYLDYMDLAESLEQAQSLLIQYESQL